MSKIFLFQDSMYESHEVTWIMASSPHDWLHELQFSNLAIIIFGLSTSSVSHEDQPMFIKIFGKYKALQKTTKQKRNFCARKLYFPSLNSDHVKQVLVSLFTMRKCEFYSCKFMQLVSERVGLQPQIELITKLANTASRNQKI